MTLQLPTHRPGKPRRGKDDPPRTARSDLYLVAVAVIAVALIAVLIVLFIINDGSDSRTDGSGPTTASDLSTTSLATTTSTGQTTASSAATTQVPSTNAPTNTTATSTSPSTGTPTSSDPASASAVVWPRPGSGRGFVSPEAAARGFAEMFAGFTQPVMGEYQAGDSRSGEIEVRPRANGPVTTILLRQVASDDSWSVIGVVNENVVIESPSSGATIGNPMIVNGRARAFEGTVQIRLYAGDSTEPVATGFGTGRGDGVLGPFETAVDWPTGVSGPGVLMLFTTSEDDGSMWDVAAIPVEIP